MGTIQSHVKKQQRLEFRWTNSRRESKNAETWVYQLGLLERYNDLTLASSSASCHFSAFEMCSVGVLKLQGASLGAESSRRVESCTSDGVSRQLLL